jgi:hypothetical protein
VPQESLDRIFNLARELTLLEASRFPELQIPHTPIYNTLLVLTSGDFGPSLRLSKDDIRNCGCPPQPRETPAKAQCLRPVQKPAPEATTAAERGTGTHVVHVILFSTACRDNVSGRWLEDGLSNPQASRLELRSSPKMSQWQRDSESKQGNHDDADSTRCHFEDFGGQSPSYSHTNEYMFYSSLLQPKLMQHASCDISVLQPMR